MELLEIATKSYGIRIKNKKSIRISDECTTISMDTEHTTINDSSIGRSTWEDEDYNIKTSMSDNNSPSRIASSSIRDITVQNNVVWPEDERSSTNIDQIDKVDRILRRKHSSRRVGFFIFAGTALLFLIVGIIAFVVVITSKQLPAVSTTTEISSTISTITTTTSQTTTTITTDTTTTTTQTTTTSQTTTTTTDTTTTTSQTTTTTTTSETTTTTSETTTTTSQTTTTTTDTTTTTSQTTTTTTDTTTTTSETTTTTSETTTTTDTTTTASSTSSTSTTSTTSTSTTASTSSTSSTSTSSTTSTSTSTTTTYSCSATEPQILGTITGSSTTTWIEYSYNYTATKPVPILSFGISAPSNIYVYIDDASIVDNSNSSVELLTNPSFAASSTFPTGWDIWCSSGCSGYGGTVVNTSCRDNNCYRGRCTTTNSDYLIQPFPTTVGHQYTISFWYYRYRSGGSIGSSSLYVGII